MLRLPRLLQPEPATPEQMRRWGARGCAERGFALPPMAGGAGYALVGSAGALSGPSSSVTPAWGTGESRTAGNLLVALAYDTTPTLPSTPSGWSIATSGTSSASGSCIIFYKIAAGGDAAPTITVTTGNVAAILAEFSGNVATSPVDQHTGSSGGSNTTFALPGTDVTAGELFLYVATLGGSATMSLNNGMTVQNLLASTSANTGYGITTTNASADQLSSSVNMTSVAIASFKVGGGGRIRMIV